MQNTIQNKNTEIKNKLAQVYSNSEIQQLRFLIYEKALGFTKTHTLTNSDFEINHDQDNVINEMVSRLANNEPIQYILGTTDFYNLQFNVNPDVLIPRPETEELVQWIIDTNKNKHAKILDIGTGSGCIAISLKKNIDASDVYALDFSEKALKTATSNAQLNHTIVNFIQSNILQTKAKLLPSNIDILVSNPPYVRECEKKLMHANVLNYEPHLALFVEDEEPLIFYEKIAFLGTQILKHKGDLFFEINEAMGASIILMLEKMGYNNTIVKKDMSGKDRMIKATNLGGK